MCHLLTPRHGLNKGPGNLVLLNDAMASVGGEIEHNVAVNFAHEILTQMANQPITRRQLSSTSFLCELAPAMLKETNDFLWPRRLQINLLK